MSVVRIKKFKDKAGNQVAGLTPEHAIYDDVTGVRLDTKLAGMNLSNIETKVTEGVQTVKNQEIASVLAVSAQGETYQEEIDDLSQKVGKISGDVETLSGVVETHNEKLSELGVKTSEISKETIETDYNSIDIEDNNGNKVFHLDEEGLDAKNVKSNGKSVLTEHQDISGLATKEDVNGKQDVIPQVSQADADSSESEQIFASDDYNNEDGTGEVYAKIGEYGVEAKNLVDTLNLNGNEICDYYAIGSSGNHTLVSGRGCSHYISCKGATRMHVRMIQEPSASGYGLAFYDDSKAFVSFVPNPIGEQGIKDVELRIPKNASYFRTTYYNFENSKIYGEFEGMLLYRKGILGNGKYRPYQEGNIYFSQKINQSPYSWKETDASVKLPVNDKVTTGVLLLPRSYTPNGKKTKLIMYCHGYSHGVYYGTWGSTSNFQTQKEHWADMGFAVMDCNGARDSNRQASGANNYATAPQNVDAYHKCYEYIIENYNIAPGIYIVGGSMGGQVCMQYCYTHGNNISACVLLSAHVDSHAWFDTAHPKGDLWGIEGDVIGSMIDAEATKDVFCGFVPEARYIDIAGKKYNFEFPCSVMALWGEQETGSIIIEKMRNLIEILRNSGYEATCRMIEGLAHSDVVSGANMVVDTEIANWFNRK